MTLGLPRFFGVGDSPTGNTDLHPLVTSIGHTLKKGRVWIRKPVSIWCDHHLLHAAWHLLGIELILLLIVACEMLCHSSSMSVQSFWILVGTGTCCHIRQSRASQTCSMGDMFGEYAGHGGTGTFSACRNCVQILAVWGHALLCWNMRWWWKMNRTTMGLSISSRYLCALTLRLCSGRIGPIYKFSLWTM